MTWRAKQHLLVYTGSLSECSDGVWLPANCIPECEAIFDSWPYGMHGGSGPCRVPLEACMCAFVYASHMHYCLQRTLTMNQQFDSMSASLNHAVKAADSHLNI